MNRKTILGIGIAVLLQAFSPIHSLWAQITKTKHINGGMVTSLAKSEGVPAIDEDGGIGVLYKYYFCGIAVDSSGNVVNGAPIL